MNRSDIIEFLEMTTILILVSCIIILAGCGTGFCIKIDGKYQDKAGSVEYCYDPAKGIFTNPDVKSILVTEEELKQIKNDDIVESKTIDKIKLIDKLLARFK